MITLRDDQTTALTDTQASFARGNRATVLQAPCGFGKTIVAAEIARLALAKGRRVTISAPRVQLTQQAENTLAELQIRGAVVDTKQALVMRPLDTDLLIDDEAHYGCSDAWAARINDLKARGGWALGLTASPVPGMDRCYDDMVRGPEPAWLMEQGHLSRYRAFGPSSPDMANVRFAMSDYGRDYARGQTEELMDKPSVTGDAAEAWLKYARGKRTVGFCVSRKHAWSVAEHLRAHGIRAGYIDGTMSRAERDRIINQFADLEIEWLASVSLITLGFDMGSQIGRDVTIEAMHDLDPTRSIPKHVQKVGRATRKKNHPAILLDSAGNLARNGFPDDEYEWSIVSGVTRRSSVNGPAVSICSHCFAAFRTAPTCPYCHSVRELTPREIEQRDGELREIERQADAKRKRIEVGRADGLDALVKIAKERGYKTGWVVQRMKLKGQTVDYGAVVRAMGRV